MQFSWYGTAAVMLESDGYRIAIDPFLGMLLHEKPFRRERLTAKYRTADSVLVTHGHFDHIYDIPTVYYNSQTEIYATATPCLTLKRSGVGESRLRLITPGDSFTLGGFTIRIYQGRHCTFDFGVIRKTVCKADTLLHPKRMLKLLRLNRQFPENGETLFYEIEADGKRLQLMGSMGLDADTDYPTGADALILPFQGTANPAETVKPIIERLQPKAIYLDHYDDAFPPMSSLVPTSEFAEEMTRRGIPTTEAQLEKTYRI